MKKTILGIALLTTGLTGAAFAAPQGQMRADPLGDKTVTKAEFVDAHSAKFNTMDTNRDGKLDAADRAAHMEQRRAKMFERLDANKDGNVSRAEFDAARKDRADAPQGERREGMRGGKRHGGGMGMMRMADTNKDGAISREEFAAAHTRMFDMADANKDGNLTAEERKAHHAQMRQKMGGKRAGGHAGHGDMPPPPPPAN